MVSTAHSSFLTVFIEYLQGIGTPEARRIQREIWTTSRIRGQWLNVRVVARHGVVTIVRQRVGVGAGLPVLEEHAAWWDISQLPRNIAQSSGEIFQLCARKNCTGVVFAIVTESRAEISSWVSLKWRRIVPEPTQIFHNWENPGRCMDCRLYSDFDSFQFRY